MNKLNKDRMGMLEQHVGAVEHLRDELESAIADFNNMASEKYEDIENLRVALNDAIANANDFMQEVAVEMQEYYDARSEKWQEGDTGQAYQDWIREWEEGLYDVDVDPFNEIEMPDCDALDALKGLNTEVPQ